MANPILIRAFACALLALAPAFSHAGEPLRDRRAFADAMNKVKAGMSEDAVIALVGRPDDVSTEKDWPWRHGGTLKILRYGASGHMKAATLGQICIGKDHRVPDSFGERAFSGQGAPPPEGLFTEAELRRLLEALNDLPGLHGLGYNPRPVIRAVNLLQPLGKKKAMAAIDEYLRVSLDFTDEGQGAAQQGLFLLLRTLFEVQTVFPDDEPSTPGYMPPMYRYAAIPDEPKDKKLLPRFPIAIEGDIPFLLVEGYDLVDGTEPPNSHVEYFRKFGTLRPKPLEPTARPLEALQAFEKSPRWYFKTQDGVDYDQRERIVLSNQAMRLLETVYQVEPDSSQMLIGFGSEDRNKQILLQASKLAIRWDAKESKYMFLDGTSLQPPDPYRYSVHFWTPKIAGLKIEFTMKRKSRKYVDLGLAETYEIGKPRPRAVVRVIDIKLPKKAIHAFELGEPSPETAARFASATVELAEGEEIRAVLVIGEKSFPSPVFKP
jgi:hypothetical protein